VTDTRFASPSPEFRQQVYDALKAWSTDPAAGGTLAGLRLVQVELDAGAANPRQAANRVLLQGLKALAVTHDREAALLRMRFLDGLPIHIVANRLNAAEPSIYRWQSQGIDHLAAVLWAGEQQIIDSRVAELEARLEPASYSELFGVEAHQTLLLERLFAPAPPFLVSISGIGGIGKTSLADAVLRAAIRSQPSAEVAWVSARRQRFDFGGKVRNLNQPALTVDALLEALAVQLLPGTPKFTAAETAIAALRACCARQPSLLVVDNLETAADVDSLLPVLHQLANPAHVLLTTRHSLYGEPGIFHFQVPELSEPDALRLVRLEATQRNLPELSEANDAELHPIYQTVGGNPLAIRLVVGQTHVRSLPGILDDLATARGATAENLYDYIYKAAWGRLDETCRRALLAMPLVTQYGGSLEQLAAISGLDAGELSDALAELVTLSLVDGRAPLVSERRYTIHALTRTFLLEQVARWM
jgi:hypothetical protein